MAELFDNASKHVLMYSVGATSRRRHLSRRNDECDLIIIRACEMMGIIYFGIRAVRFC